MLLSNQLDRLDRDFARITTLLRQYDDATLNRKPAPNAWSALQVVQHLMLAEGLSLKYIKKKLSFGVPPKAGFSSTFRRWMLKLYLRAPLKTKAPKIVSEPIQDTAVGSELLAQWAALRTETRAFLETLPESTVKSECYKHAVAGKMDLRGMLTFFEEHFNHHEKQILGCLSR